MKVLLVTVLAFALLAVPAAAHPVVAVIDSGVDASHPALRGLLGATRTRSPATSVDDDRDGFVDDVHGADFLDDDGWPRDARGHGTHVAGIDRPPADRAPPHRVATGARIMALRVVGRRGPRQHPGARRRDQLRRRPRRPRHQHLARLLRAVAGADVRAAARLRRRRARRDRGGQPAPRTSTARPSSPPRTTCRACSSSAPSSGRRWLGGRRAAPRPSTSARRPTPISTCPGNRWGKMTGTSQSAAHVSRAAALLLAARPGLTAAARAPRDPAQRERGCRSCAPPPPAAASSTSRRHCAACGCRY